MKRSNVLSVLLLALFITSTFVSIAVAEEEDSITITIDRKVMPQSLLHPERFKTDAETFTVYDYVIRDYSGNPIDGFIVQTASGQTTIPIDTVKQIRTEGWIHRETDDIAYVENVVRAYFLFTDGTQEQYLMNADFGTIEGETDLGEFFLGNPHSVKSLTFNRVEKKPEPKKVVKAVPKPAPGVPDSDGDGVPDSADKCPDTPWGVPVDENGCPFDSDGDGVPDYKDECPDTPKGAPVNIVGCWILKGINFGYNKADIKPQYYGLLDENIKVLQMNPNLIVEIQGHTDSIGSQEYNQPLSEQRAESVKNYFILKGVSMKRIFTRGFGKLAPIASNETEEGRAQNRRIEIRVISK